MDKKRRDTCQKPDLSLLLDSAKKCRKDDTSLAMDHYLCIMHEISKLLQYMYKGLNTVLQDVKPALKALEFHRVSGARCYYGNVNLMVHYEKENHLLKGSSKLASGTVALWDVNTALGFAIEFLQNLQEKERADKSFSMAERIGVYTATMRQHHSALTQTSCKIRLAGCPGRQGLMTKFTSCCHGELKPVVLLGNIINLLVPLHTDVDRVLMDVESCV